MQESAETLQVRHFLIVSFLFLTMAGLTSCGRPRPAEEASDVAMIPGSAFSIRISEFSEINGGFVPGAYYRFESLRPDGAGWVNALEFRHDDLVPPPKENVKFIHADIAFIFMGWKYAVTTDGARHWTVWNAQADLPGWQCCNYGLIKSVALDASGTGRMVLNPIPGRAGEVGELFTSDFGRHWAARAAANTQ